MKFKRISYINLNGRQQEIYNFQVASGVLARYGFHTHRIPDDWLGADFIARNMVNNEQILVQLKSRATFSTKYRDKNIWICFVREKDIFLYPHDEIFSECLASRQKHKTLHRARDGGEVHWKRPPSWLNAILEPFRLSGG